MLRRWTLTVPGTIRSPGDRFRGMALKHQVDDLLFARRQRQAAETPIAIVIHGRSKERSDARRPKDDEVQELIASVC